MGLYKVLIFGPIFNFSHFRRFGPLFGPFLWGPRWARPPPREPPLAQMKSPTSPSPRSRPRKTPGTPASVARRREHLRDLRNAEDSARQLLIIEAMQRAQEAYKARPSESTRRRLERIMIKQRALENYQQRLDNYEAGLRQREANQFKLTPFSRSPGQSFREAGSFRPPGFTSAYKRYYDPRPAKPDMVTSGVNNRSKLRTADLRTLKRSSRGARHTLHIAGSIPASEKTDAFPSRAIPSVKRSQREQMANRRRQATMAPRHLLLPIHTNETLRFAARKVQKAIKYGAPPEVVSRLKSAENMIRKSIEHWKNTSWAFPGK